ncbi:MAG: tRNA (adenosine(37)-N6)-threonylcarbamoyltransferase complex ATPase subunit type 1 TsaE [Helicobacteraceae bacterium]|jgi:tRNA threonylcarbamoyladenosine biosynthesis protein TsaE|nr:tRNA (adenosine(37)-N6)-threonylcarbamoyltransferase complex ATPase subunit type 1 TsaE [Helicobacteraceae bacterium]
MIKTARLPHELKPICRELIDRFPNGAVVLLRGELGAGKSEFVRQFASIFGYESASPTFGIMHEYAADFRHFDLYRIGSGGFFERGLHECALEGWAFIEWADEAIERFLAQEQVACVQVQIDVENDARVVSYE